MKPKMLRLKLIYYLWRYWRKSPLTLGQFISRCANKSPFLDVFNVNDEQMYIAMRKLLKLD